MATFRHVYVHIPFCDVICHYCHFYTARSKEALHPEFFRALSRETNHYSPALGPRLEAIYFGGGTPGASPPELIHGFLDGLRDRIGEETEITLETNPGNVTRERARKWREAGVNRVSLGVQSLDDALLKRLGRVHSAEQARRALEDCLAEIPNVTADLMYGVPGQDESGPAEQALKLVQIGAKHLSAYHLSLEPEHFLYSRLPNDSFAWEQIRRVADALGPLGFRHYEVASFAQPGRESRNNQNYWIGGPYLALGPSAHGFDGDHTRWWNVADWRAYIERVEKEGQAVAEREVLTEAQRRLEVIFTSIRTLQGLDLEAFARKFGEDLRVSRAALLARWEKEGLGQVTNGHFVLTFAGRMLGDEIAQRLA